jgi:hypothetical protein
MGLSEREQKLLEEMERELLSSDAEFANRLKNPEKGSASKLVGGVLVMLAGVALLILAVALQVAFFGVFAFAVMLIGLIIASNNLKFPDLPKPGQQDSGGFFEQRWNQRFGE